MNDLTSGTRSWSSTQTSNFRRGEVLGIAGLIGAGRTELLRLIAGARPPTSGSITLNGRSSPQHGTRAAIAAASASLPEERKREGNHPATLRGQQCRAALDEALCPARFHPPPRASARRRPRSYRYQLRPLQIDRPIRLFSGGNQQKAIIARWIAANCQILLFDEPTRGIDIGAKAEIYSLIERLAAEGKVDHRRLLRASGDHPASPIASLVMRQGRIAAQLRAQGSERTGHRRPAVPQTFAPTNSSGHRQKRERDHVDQHAYGFPEFNLMPYHVAGASEGPRLRHRSRVAPDSRRLRIHRARISRQ